MRFKTLFLGSLLLTALPLTAQAEDRKQKQQELKGTNDTYISLSVENDNLGGGTDRFYTSGIRLTWFDADINVPPMIDTMADRIPTFDLNERTSTFYTIGHNIYTPEDITLANQPQGDRPWAAFLYGSVGMATPTFSKNGDVHHLDELEFTLGIVGPEALGEQTQKFVHKYISDSPKPEGWDNQLEFEPGFIVSWQRRFPYAWEKDFRLRKHAYRTQYVSVSWHNPHEYRFRRYSGCRLKQITGHAAACAPRGSRHRNIPDR